MARVDIPVQVLSPYGGKIEDIAYTAGDAANDHSFIHDGGTVFLVIKNGSGSPHVTTVVTEDTPRTFNRRYMSGTLNYGINTPAGGTSIAAIPAEGFLYTGSTGSRTYINIDAGTNIEFAVFRLTPLK